MNAASGIRGKTVLFVNSGGKKKQFTLERAKRLGATVVVLNGKADFREQHVDHFVEANTYNHGKCLEKLRAFLHQHPHIRLDGAVTFWEDDVPLLARACEEFGLKGNSCETAILTRNKFEMRKRLSVTGIGIPKFWLMQSEEDLRHAIESIGFPAVLKPAWGSDSEFVVFATNKEQAEETFRYFMNNCNEQFNPIFKYNNGQFLYEEYMDGMEVSVECFVQHGIPHVLGVNEKFPMKLPYFVERGDISPARLDEETERAVEKLAESALIALGVRESLAHIEIKITPQGPKIVEVASRMGGDDIHLYVKHVWGADMVEIGLQIAVGQNVNYCKKPPRDCLACQCFIPPQSGIISRIAQAPDLRHSPHLAHLVLTKKVGDAVLVPPEGFENAGWVIARGKTHPEAEAHLEGLLENIDINVTKFHRDSTLGKTAREHTLATASLVRSQILKASRLARIREAGTEKFRELHIGILSNAPSGEAIRGNLARMGYRVTVFDMNEPPLPIQKVQSAGLDFVLNLCTANPNSPYFTTHVAALLEMLHLPFSGSSSSAVAMALDKINVKKLLDYHAIPTPKWDYVAEINGEIDAICRELTFPLIVKPSNADEYHGISAASVVCAPDELHRQTRMIVQDLKRPALIEEYIEGDEIVACVLGNGDEAEVLPIIRSVFDRMPKGYWHIYSSDLFREENQSILRSIRVEKPAKIPQKLNALISEMALDIYRIFGCRDYAEIEMRVDRKGNPFVIEINPNPSIVPGDFFPVAASLADYSYEDLLEAILLTAVERYSGPAPAHSITTKATAPVSCV